VKRLVGVILAAALVTTACGATALEDAARAVAHDRGLVHEGDSVAPILGRLGQHDVLQSSVAFLGNRLESRLRRPPSGLAKLAACDYVNEAFRLGVEPSADQTASLPHVIQLATNIGGPPSTVGSEVRLAIDDALAGKAGEAIGHAWQALREECWTVGIGLG
jgi:hypothetical protein